MKNTKTTAWLAAIGISLNLAAVTASANGNIFVDHYDYHSLMDDVISYDLNFDGITDSIKTNVYTTYSETMQSNCLRYELIINGQVHHVADFRHGRYNDLYITDIDQTDSYLDIVLIDEYKGKTAKIHRYDGQKLIGLACNADDPESNHFSVWNNYWDAVNNNWDIDPYVEIKTTNSQSGVIGFTFLCGGESYSYIKNSELCYVETDSFPAYCYSSGEITVTLNGDKIEFDQPPIMAEGNRVMVPIRAIFEAMGYSLDWDQSTQTATATKNNYTLTVKEGVSGVTLNGAFVAFDVPNQIISGRMLVPVRVVAECSGALVSWDGETKTVNLLSQK